MTCDECLLLMEEDLDAELDGRTAGILAPHLAACSHCAKEYQTLRREREIYAQYSRDFTVTPALWAAVQTRLEGDLKSSRFTLWRTLRSWVAGLTIIPRLTPIFAASLILIAIVITSVVMRMVNRSQHEAKGGAGSQEARRELSQPLIPPPRSLETEATGLRAQQPASPVLSISKPRHRFGASSESAMKTTFATPPKKRAPTVQALVAQAEQKYLAAIAILSRDVEKSRPALDPRLRARFEETLTAIDRTIADTRQAVGEHPTDPEAVRYMLTAYAKKVEVLQEMASY